MKLLVFVFLSLGLAHASENYLLFKTGQVYTYDFSSISATETQDVEEKLPILVTTSTPEDYEMRSTLKLAGKVQIASQCIDGSARNMVAGFGSVQATCTGAHRRECFRYKAFGKKLAEQTVSFVQLEDGSFDHFEFADADEQFVRNTKYAILAILSAGARNQTSSSFVRQEYGTEAKEPFDVMYNVQRSKAFPAGMTALVTKSWNYIYEKQARMGDRSANVHHSAEVELGVGITPNHAEVITAARSVERFIVDSRGMGNSDQQADQVVVMAWVELQLNAESQAQSVDEVDCNAYNATAFVEYSSRTAHISDSLLAPLDELDKLLSEDLKDVTDDNTPRAFAETKTEAQMFAEQKANLNDFKKKIQQMPNIAQQVFSVKFQLHSAEKKLIQTAGDFDKLKAAYEAYNKAKTSDSETKCNGYLTQTFREAGFVAGTSTYTVGAVLDFSESPVAADGNVEEKTNAKNGQATEHSQAKSNFRTPLMIALARLQALVQAGNLITGTGNVGLTTANKGTNTEWPVFKANVLAPTAVMAAAAVAMMGAPKAVPTRFDKFTCKDKDTAAAAGPNCEKSVAKFGEPLKKIWETVQAHLNERPKTAKKEDYKKCAHGNTDLINWLGVASLNLKIVRKRLSLMRKKFASADGKSKMSFLLSRLGMANPKEKPETKEEESKEDLGYDLAETTMVLNLCISGTEHSSIAKMDVNAFNDLANKIAGIAASGEPVDIAKDFLKEQVANAVGSFGGRFNFWEKTFGMGSYFRAQIYAQTGVMLNHADEKSNQIHMFPNLGAGLRLQAGAVNTDVLALDWSPTVTHEGLENGTPMMTVLGIRVPLSMKPGDWVEALIPPTMSLLYTKFRVHERITNIAIDKMVKALLYDPYLTLFQGIHLPSSSLTTKMLVEMLPADVVEAIEVYKKDDDYVQPDGHFDHRHHRHAYHAAAAAAVSAIHPEMESLLEFSSVTMESAGAQDKKLETPVRPGKSPKSMATALHGLWTLVSGFTTVKKEKEIETLVEGGKFPLALAAMKAGHELAEYLNKAKTTIDSKLKDKIVKVAEIPFDALEKTLAGGAAEVASLEAARPSKAKSFLSTFQFKNVPVLVAAVKAALGAARSVHDVVRLSKQLKKPAKHAAYFARWTTLKTNIDALKPALDALIKALGADPVAQVLVPFYDNIDNNSKALAMMPGILTCYFEDIRKKMEEMQGKVQEMIAGVGGAMGDFIIDAVDVANAEKERAEEEKAKEEGTTDESEPAAEEPPSSMQQFNSLTAGNGWDAPEIEKNREASRTFAERTVEPQCVELVGKMQQVFDPKADPAKPQPKWDKTKTAAENNAARLQWMTDVKSSGGAGNTLATFSKVVGMMTPAAELCANIIGVAAGSMAMAKAIKTLNEAESTTGENSKMSAIFDIIRESVDLIKKLQDIIGNFRSMVEVFAEEDNTFIKGCLLVESMLHKLHQFAYHLTKNFKQDSSQAKADKAGEKGVDGAANAADSIGMGKSDAKVGGSVLGSKEPSPKALSCHGGRVLDASTFKMTPVFSKKLSIGRIPFGPFGVVPITIVISFEIRFSAAHEYGVCKAYQRLSGGGDAASELLAEADDNADPKVKALDMDKPIAGKTHHMWVPDLGAELWVGITVQVGADFGVINLGVGIKLNLQVFALHIPVHFIANLDEHAGDRKDALKNAGFALWMRPFISSMAGEVSVFIEFGVRFEFTLYHWKSPLKFVLPNAKFCTQNAVKDKLDVCPKVVGAGVRAAPSVNLLALESSERPTNTKVCVVCDYENDAASGVWVCPDTPIRQAVLAGIVDLDIFKMMHSELRQSKISTPAMQIYNFMAFAESVSICHESTNNFQRGPANCRKSPLECLKGKKPMYEGTLAVKMNALGGTTAPPAFFSLQMNRATVTTNTWTAVPTKPAADVLASWNAVDKEVRDATNGQFTNPKRAFATESTASFDKATFKALQDAGYKGKDAIPVVSLGKDFKFMSTYYTPAPHEEISASGSSWVTSPSKPTDEALVKLPGAQIKDTEYTAQCVRCNNLPWGDPVCMTNGRRTGLMKALPGADSIVNKLLTSELNVIGHKKTMLREMVPKFNNFYVCNEALYKKGANTLFSGYIFVAGATDGDVDDDDPFPGTKGVRFVVHDTVKALPASKLAASAEFLTHVTTFLVMKDASKPLRMATFDLFNNYHGYVAKKQAAERPCVAKVSTTPGDAKKLLGTYEGLVGTIVDYDTTSMCVMSEKGSNYNFGAEEEQMKVRLAKLDFIGTDGSSKATENANKQLNNALRHAWKKIEEDPKMQWMELDGTIFASACHEMIASVVSKGSSVPFKFSWVVSVDKAKGIYKLVAGKDAAVEYAVGDIVDFRDDLARSVGKGELPEFKPCKSVFASSCYDDNVKLIQAWLNDNAWTERALKSFSYRQFFRLAQLDSAEVYLASLCFNSAGWVQCKTVAIPVQMIRTDPEKSHSIKTAEGKALFASIQIADDNNDFSPATWLAAKSHNMQARERSKKFPQCDINPIES